MTAIWHSRSLKRFQALGGHTVVDTTNIGIGREPAKLARIAKMSGLKIVMGTGFYLEFSHPDWLKNMDVDEVTEFIVNDVGGGTAQPDVMAALSVKSASARISHRRNASRYGPPPAPRKSRECRCPFIYRGGNGWRMRFSILSRRRALIYATPSSVT